MAVTRTSRSIVMTAAADAVTGPLLCDSIALIGTSMVAGQRLTITDTDGAKVVDHYVESANENVEFLRVPLWVRGLTVSAAPANGTWTVSVRLK